MILISELSQAWYKGRPWSSSAFSKYDDLILTQQHKRKECNSIRWFHVIFIITKKRRRKLKQTISGNRKWRQRRWVRLPKTAWGLTWKKFHPNLVQNHYHSTLKMNPSEYLCFCVSSKCTLQSPPFFEIVNGMIG